MQTDVNVLDSLNSLVPVDEDQTSTGFTTIEDSDIGLSQSVNQNEVSESLNNLTPVDIESSEVVVAKPEGQPIYDEETETYIFRDAAWIEENVNPVDKETKSRYEKISDAAAEYDKFIEAGAASTILDEAEINFAIEFAESNAAMQEAMLGVPGMGQFMFPERVSTERDEIINEAKRDKFVQDQVISNMEDGSFKDFISIGGADALETVMTLSNKYGAGTAAFTDAMQSLFETWKSTNEDSYRYVFVREPKAAADAFSREVSNFFTMAEGIPVLGSIATLGTRYKAAAGQVIKIEKEAKKIANKTRFNAYEATTNAAQAKKTKRLEAKKVADANQGIRQQLIYSFEQAIGARSKDKYDASGVPEIIDKDLLISIDEDGIIKLDNPQAKEAARKKLEELNTKNNRGDQLLETFGLQDETDEIPDFLIDDNGEITIPIIKAENLDSFTAIAKEVLQRKPELYDPSKGLVDNLFEMSVNKDIIPSDDLLELLNKYDISFEEYATMMLGSASQAGRVLNKFSQISQRVKPANAARAAQEKAMIESMNGFRKFFMRVENIRRGLLVSQLATAGRNLSSAGIRAPLEGLQNMMDTALYSFSEAKGPLNSLVQGGKTFVPGQGNWTGSFKHMRYMFDPTRMKDASQITDYVLTNPKYASQFDMMFNTINEVRRSTGQGTAKTKFGKGVDGVLTAAESVVDVINLPNRWQEHLIRRGAFAGELERLVKREYGFDLNVALNQGKLQDLINDAPSIVPKGKRSFTELVADATDKALDITYAKQPDTPVFRELTSFITRNGLTVVAPFPRFMFNSMELAGNYTGGAFAPVIKRSITAVTGDLGKATGKLTAKERKQISRNIIGATVILPAAIMYRNQEDAPSDYKMLRVDDGTILDSTPQSPVLRQALFVAETLKRIKDGTFSNWFDMDDVKQTWLGTNVRTGTGGVIFEDLTKIFTTADALGGEKGKELAGKLVAEYATTFLTPITQLIELQRVNKDLGGVIPIIGERTSTYTDTRKEPLLGRDPETGGEREGPFMRGFGQTFDARSMSTIFNPSEQDNLPARETVFQEEGEPRRRTGVLLKVFTGLGTTKELSEAGQFMEKLGFKDYKVPSRTISKGFNQFETRVLRLVLPSIVEAARSNDFVRQQKQLARRSNAENEQKYVNVAQIKFIKDQIKFYKTQMEDYILDKDADGLVTADGSPIDEKLTMYLRTQQTYRRMSKADREAAFLALPDLLRKLNIKEEPNLGDIVHLQAMIDYNKSTTIK